MDLNPFLKYLTVIVSSMVKFIFGPFEGLALGLTKMDTALATAFGMMISVVLITLFFHFFKSKVFSRFGKKRKLFTAANRRKVRVWSKYGILGVSFLTPVILSPIGGALIANAFGEKKYKIFLWMTVMALGWGFVMTYAVYELSHLFGF
ncbi:MAG: hypothetical protein ACOYN9_10090 [Saprospiraceae bacterium]